jgi:NADH-quinone oxidoreductase subunit J
VLYTQYVYAFEIAAVLLVVAIVAAIALTFRRRTGVRQQDISQQVRVKKQDRLRIVQMPAEKPEAAPSGDAASS